MATIRGFGRDPIEDSRDNDYLLRRKSTKKRSKVWRLGPILDQRDSNMCVGYSWAQWLASEPTRQYPLRASGIYKLAQHLDEWIGTDYEGTSVRAGAKVLQATGHITEYRWAPDLSRLLFHLLEKGPCVMGSYWYEGMMSCDDDGFIHATGRQQGGHAYLLYGANLPKSYVNVCNSWGKRWGVGGTAKLPLKDVVKLLKNRGEACAASEQPASRVWVKFD